MNHNRSTALERSVKKKLLGGLNRFEVYKDMVEILLMLQVFLADDPEIEYLFSGRPSGSETCLLFCNDGSVVLAQLQSK